MLRTEIDMIFHFFGTSDNGCYRKHNEDRFVCNPKEKLFLVADGIGGQASGEIASEMAINCVEEFVVRSRQEDITWPIPYREELSIELNRLLAGATLANHKIRALANQHPSMRGMGTTLVGVIIEKDHLAIINIGDSRLYRIRAGQMEQITQDHTLVGLQESIGLLTKEQASNHPQRHILTSALGIEAFDNINVDLFPSKILKKDIYLMCSDGLHDMLEDIKILETIESNRGKSLEHSGRSLIDQANLAGGRDNITVVLLSFK
jgi:serine/threonine protein phosphatase PrpC